MAATLTKPEYPKYYKTQNLITPLIIFVARSFVLIMIVF